MELNDFREQIIMYLDQKQRIEELEVQRDIGIFRVNSQKLNDKFLPSPIACLDKMYDLLPKLGHEAYTAFISEVHEATTKLSARLTSVGDFVEVLDFLGTCHERWPSYDKRMGEIKELYEIVEEFNISVPEIDRAAYQTLQPDFTALKSALEECEAAKDDNVTKFSKELEKGVEMIAKEVTHLRNLAQHEMILDENSDEDTVLAFRRNADDIRRGGDISADDVSFNAGLIYKPVPEIGLFASFSQGFSIPDIGLSAGTRLPTDVDISTDVELSPQQVDNFEIGVRAEFEQVQASLSGFYNESSLGTNLQVGPDGFTDVVRAPPRNYGVEATLDWQPSDVWRLGGYFSWNEGESDNNDAGDFLALSGLQVQPYKVGLYLENDTAPGWTNRLQLLGVGGRDRAFDDGVDAFDIDGYVTLDLLSSIQLGDGQLTVGVQNLLNNQYLPLSSQERVRGTEDRRFAAPGINLNIGYSIEF